MSEKKSLRAALLGAARWRKERVTVDLGDGPREIEVRQPSVEARSKIMHAGNVVNAAKSGGVDLGRMQVAAVLACCFDPETNARAFEAADEQALLEHPAGGWFDELATKAMELLNVDQEDARKSNR